LALVGSAGDRGRSRDQLISFLWPDTEPTEARQHLSHSLYSLRKELGQEGIRTAGEYVRLSPAHVSVDSVAFEGRLRESDRAAAVGLYAGSFMDGFFIDGAPEFEHWVDSERRRLASLYAHTVEDLARDAIGREDPATAAEWWGSLVAHDPYNSAAVVSLMEALDSAGDPANAIQYAQDHIRVLEEEFGMGPPEDVVAKIEELRSRDRGWRGSVAVVQPSVRGSARGDYPPVLSPTHTRGWGLLAKRTVLTAISAAAVLAILWSGISARLGGESGQPNVVLVRNVENLTGDEALDKYGQFAEYVIVSGLTGIDTVLVVMDDEIDLPDRAERLAGPELVRELARVARAGLVVESSFIEDSDSLFFEVRVLDPFRGEVLDGVQATAHASEPMSAVRVLRDRVLVAIATRLNLGEHYGPSYGRGDSYQAWQEVEAARDLWAEGGREREAFSRLKRALEIDSTFDAARGLAMIWHLNFGEMAQADSVSRALDDRIGVISPRQRWQLAVQKAVLRRDAVAARDAFRDWRRRLANTSSLFHETIGSVLTRRYRECIATLDRIERSALNRGHFQQYAFCHHALGEYAAALFRAEEGLEETPDDPVLLHEQARAEAALGRPTAAVTLVREIHAIGIQPRTGETLDQERRFDNLVGIGLELSAHGHPEEAAEVFAAAVDWYRARARISDAPSDRWRLARALYAAGQWEEARSAFRSLAPAELVGDPLLMSHNIDVSLLGYRAALAVRLGDDETAWRIENELTEMERPFLWGHAAYWRATIAAVRGDREATVERLTEAMQIGLFPVQWGTEYPKWDYHVDPDFESVRDYQPFQDLVAPRG